jgi:hypothetical protein
VGRRAVQDFGADAWLGAEQSGDEAASRDAHGRGGAVLQRAPRPSARRGNRDRMLVRVGQFLRAGLIRLPLQRRPRAAPPPVLIISTLAFLSATS